MCFQTKALNEMKQRNERILEHYEQVLSVSPVKRDSCDMDFKSYIRIFKLTPSQGHAFKEYSQKVIANAVAQSQMDAEVNSIVKAKSITMYQETKDLLEMQFAKIQHETESLQIWCGILTVVFLIFSFYSLFKTDELVQQGRDGVKELSSLQESGKMCIDEMKQNGLAKISTFETESKEAIAKINERASAEKMKIEEEVNKKKDNAITAIDQRINEANLMLDQKYQDLANALEDKTNGVPETGADVDDLIKQINSRLDVLGLRLEAIEHSNTKDNG